MKRSRKNASALYVLAFALCLFFLFGLPALHLSDAVSSRSWAFAGALSGALALLMAFGMQISGSVFGILAEARNTYSLSRLQMVLWTWLVFSALVATAAGRGWAGGAETALNIAIPDNLLVAMGISYFTGAAAPALLSLKARNTPTPGQLAGASLRMGQKVSSNGQLLVRRPGNAPQLSDMIKGDDLATAGTVDISKVQQLLFTLVLVCGYGAMLFHFFGGPGFSPDKTGGVPTTSLPDFSPQFLTLLAISHGGYLAYKAAPRQAPSSDLTQPWASPPNSAGG